MLEPILAEFGAFCRTITFDAADDPVRVQPDRHLDHGRRRHRPRLLGAPPPQRGALQRRHRHDPRRPQPRAARGRPGPHAGQPGPAWRRPRRRPSPRRCATRRRRRPTSPSPSARRRPGVGGRASSSIRRRCSPTRSATACRCRPIRSSASATGSIPTPSDAHPAVGQGRAAQAAASSTTGSPRRRGAARSPPRSSSARCRSSVVVIGDGHRWRPPSPLVSAAADRVVSVVLGERFQRHPGGRFEVNPGRADDWVGARRGAGRRRRAARAPSSTSPRSVRRAVAAASGSVADDDLVAYHETIARDHASMLFLARALSAISEPVRLALVTSGVHALGSDRSAAPRTGAAPRRRAGHPARARPRRPPWPSTSICPKAGSPAAERLVAAVEAELDAEWATDVVVLRRGERWVRTLRAGRAAPGRRRRRGSRGGVYLITGGLGGIGLSIAQHIAKSSRARRRSCSSAAARCRPRSDVGRHPAGPRHRPAGAPAHRRRPAAAHARGRGRRRRRRRHRRGRR